MNLTLGRLYEVTFYDHYTRDNQSSEEAVKESPIICKVYGVYVGKKPKYHVFSHFFISLGNSNNDNNHIVEKAIIEIKELTYTNGVLRKVVDKL